jgi:hypothetical protein
MGYNAARLFPGYNGVVRKVEEDNIAYNFMQWLNERHCFQSCEKDNELTQANE